MIHPRSLIIIYCFITSLSLASPANAGLIVNGDFDDSVPTNGIGSGWASSNLFFSPSFPGGWMSSGGNPDANFVLNSGGESDSDPIISQILSGLAIGTEYVVTGEYKPIYEFTGNASALSFGVLLDGIPILELNRGISGMFTPFSVVFTATGTTHMIGFAAERNGDDSSFAVDNLDANANNTVPEPSTFILWLTGYLALVISGYLPVLPGILSLTGRSSGAARQDL